MNKYIIDGVLVVEGENDRSYLSSLFDCPIYITNGYDVNSGDLEFLKELNKKYKLIILTDSDSAGKKIRNDLNELLMDTINVEVDILKCNKRNKHGVAECDKEELINKLKPYFVEKRAQNVGILTKNDLFSLCLTGPESECNNKIISNKFHLGRCNSKTLLTRINLLNITKQEIIDVLKEYGNK